VAGSSSAAFICVASKIGLSAFITSSRARIDFSRPTNSGTIMCGNTTMSRSGRTG
jgi:acyl-CoA hydrolase